MEDKDEESRPTTPLLSLPEDKDVDEVHEGLGTSYLICATYG